MLNLFKGDDKGQTFRFLTAELFFKENNPNGYCTYEEFNYYLKCFNRSEAARLGKIFRVTSEGAHLNNGLAKSFDKTDGTELLWFRFQHAKQTFAPLSISYNAALVRFFKDYQLGKIKPKFELEELITVSGYPEFSKQFQNSEF